jgi:hypothetical protein
VCMCVLQKVEIIDCVVEGGFTAVLLRTITLFH